MAEIPTVTVPFEVHPSMVNLLKFFKYDHLPARLQAVSRPFCELARHVAETLQGAEATVCLRKLLEAKDCAVRAKLMAINDGDPIPPDPKP